MGDEVAAVVAAEEPVEEVYSKEKPRLRLPSFEWYLGPMYKRHQDILQERARANKVVVVEKKKICMVPPEPPWLKYVKLRDPVYAFSRQRYDRPLHDLGKMYYPIPGGEKRKPGDAKLKKSRPAWPDMRSEIGG